MFEIESARTRTRPWIADEREIETFSRWVRNPDMIRYISNGETWSDEAIEKFFLRQRNNLETSGVCFGAVEEKASGSIIGVGGIAPLELVPDYHLGWWIDPGKQGRGFATELAASLVDYVFDVMKLPRALAICHEGNIASQNVMKKAGMHFMDRVPGNALESRWAADENMVYAITREARIPAGRR